MDLLAEPPSPSPSPAKMDLSPDWRPSPDSSTTSLFIRRLFAYLSCNFYGTRFVLIPFTLRMCIARGSSVENFQSEIFFIVFDLVLRKVGKL